MSEPTHITHPNYNLLPVDIDGFDSLAELGPSGVRPLAAYSDDSLTSATANVRLTTNVNANGGLGNSLTFDGWYSQLAYTLTGEPRPYKTDRGIFDGVRPNKNFGADGWGAFEVAVRLSNMNLSDGNINGGEENNVTYALNWYLNQFLRASFNVVDVLTVNRGPFPDEAPMIYQMRLQLAL